MNELSEVEHTLAADRWNPKGFDLEAEPLSRLVAHLQLPQILASLVLNGTVLTCAVTNASHLLSSAASVLMVSVFLNYFAFAVLMAETRIALLLSNNEWSKVAMDPNQCVAFASICVFFVAHGAFNLMAICFERYLALVKLIRVKRIHAIYGLLASMVTSLGLTVLHFFPHGGAIISRSGLYCFPTRLQAWQGALDAAAMVVHFVAILWGYLLIYLQLRKLARKTQSSMNFPGLGKSTLANLGHKLGLSSLLPSATPTAGQGAAGASSSSASASKGAVATRSMHGDASHPRSLHDPCTPALSQTASVPHVVSPSNGTAGQGVSSASSHVAARDVRVSTVSLEKSKSLLKITSTTFARQAKAILSPNHPEGRVVLRGLLSLAAYSCFVVTYSHLAWVSLLFQQRPSVQWDWFLVTTRLFPDIGDPLILFYLDRQFREALFRLVQT